jgi:hypothetical protein
LHLCQHKANNTKDHHKKNGILAVAIAISLHKTEADKGTKITFVVNKK